MLCPTVLVTRQKLRNTLRDELDSRAGDPRPARAGVTQAETTSPGGGGGGGADEARWAPAPRERTARHPLSAAEGACGRSIGSGPRGRGVLPPSAPGLPPTATGGLGAVTWPLCAHLHQRRERNGRAAAGSERAGVRRAAGPAWHTRAPPRGPPPRPRAPASPTPRTRRAPAAERPPRGPPGPHGGRRSGKVAAQRRWRRKGNQLTPTLAVALTRGRFCSPGDTWQRLWTAVAVTATAGAPGSGGRPGQPPNMPQQTKQPTQRPSSSNVTQVEAENSELKRPPPPTLSSI